MKAVQMAELDCEQMEIDDVGGGGDGFYQAKIEENLNPPISKRLPSGMEKISETKSNKSLPSSSLSSSSSSSSSAAAAVVSKRTFLKAKRNRLPPKCRTICVLDTNILLQNLTQIKTIIVNRKNPMFYRSDNNNGRTCTPIVIEQIVVPWIVIQELDGLKKSDQIKEATNAIRFINEQFKNNGLIKGENSTVSVCSVEEYSNDDKILNCCLHLYQKHTSSKSLPSTSTTGQNNNKPDNQPSMKVILISNDCNLQNKALIHNIEALSIDEFNDKYFNLKMIQQSEEASNSNQQQQTPNKLPNEDIYYQTLSKPRKLQKTTSENRNQQVSFSPSSQLLLNEICRNLTKKPNVAKMKQQLNEKDKISKKNESDTIQLPQQSSSSSHQSSNNPTQLNNCPDDNRDSNNVPNNNNSEDNLNVRYKLETVLVPFIVDQFVTIFGEPLWRKMIPQFKPKSSSLYDCLQVIKKNWIGVFSDYFNRSRQIRDLVNDILERLKRSDIQTSHSDSSSALGQKCQQLLKQIHLYRSKKTNENNRQ